MLSTTQKKWDDLYLDSPQIGTEGCVKALAALLE